MTPMERETILDFALGRLPKDDLLRSFGTKDGRQLGLDLLNDAVVRHDGLDAELALDLCFPFGIDEAHEPALLKMAPARWHQRHEDVVSALDGFTSPEAIAALVYATQWVPDYLEFDDVRAMATKAVWALGKTPGELAEAALHVVAESENTIISEGAKNQLERRRLAREKTR